MLIARTIEIDMAHRLPGHGSKCQNLHGHRYTIEVGVDDQVIQRRGAADEGMVIDFADLKALMMEHIDAVYDHNTMLSMHDPIANDLIAMLEPVQEKKPVLVDFVPTVENITRHFYEILQPLLKEKGIQLRQVKVWETPNCWAVYEG
jgi:6-pyruvoyltetrahydropterin/6-carboxytetrahydropterin synthase